MSSNFELKSMASLSDREFDRLREMIKDICGIDLAANKKELVRNRLNKRLRDLSLDSYKAYLDFVSSPGQREEIIRMVDAISTNVTHFFRESKHFDLLRDQVIKPAIQRGRRQFRVWSAGCSSGEEPYTIASVFSDTVADAASLDIRILATDISTEILDKAKQGIYGDDRLREVDPRILKKHFRKTDNGEWAVSEKLKKFVTFSRLNLMDPWPMKGPFDVIFCRNVMIYFDKQTQGDLVRRYSDLLRSGGYLLIGHSESLTGVNHGLEYEKPTVFRKVENATMEIGN